MCKDQVIHIVQSCLMMAWVIVFTGSLSVVVAMFMSSPTLLTSEAFLTISCVSSIGLELCVLEHLLIAAWWTSFGWSSTEIVLFSEVAAKSLVTVENSTGFGASVTVEASQAVGVVSVVLLAAMSVRESEVMLSKVDVTVFVIRVASEGVFTEGAELHENSFLLWGSSSELSELSSVLPKLIWS